MNPGLDARAERTRSALSTLSTVGAAVAGAAVGAMIATVILPIAWLVLATGLAAHFVGMVGTRRLLTRAGYAPPAWQRAAYWLYWLAIVVVIAFAGLRSIRV